MERQFAPSSWPRRVRHNRSCARFASVLLSTILAVPLARLFELGGNTIWPLALLHFTVQGAVKILEVPGDTVMPLVWISASALIPYLAFYFNGAQR